MNRTQQQINNDDYLFIGMFHRRNYLVDIFTYWSPLFIAIVYYAYHINKNDFCTAHCHIASLWFIPLILSLVFLFYSFYLVHLYQDRFDEEHKLRVKYQKQIDPNKSSSGMQKTGKRPL